MHNRHSAFTLQRAKAEERKFHWLGQDLVGGNSLSSVGTEAGTVVAPSAVRTES